MDIATRIDKLLAEKGISGYKMSADLHMSRSFMTELRKGRAKGVTLETARKIADYFGVPVGYLLNEEESAELKDGSNAALLLDNERLVRFPVVGSISAGYGSLAVEEYTGDFALIPFADLHSKPEDYFVLRVSGNSMYPRLLDGDRVLVRKASTVEDGKIAVVLFNGDEATIKKVTGCGAKCLELIPFNPEYEIKRIEGSDLDQCRILGEVKQLIRNL